MGTRARQSESPAPTLLDRLRTWLMADPPPGECRLWHEPKDGVTVSALGDAFHFRVFLSLRWYSVGLTRPELEDRLREHLPAVTAQVRWHASTIARGHQPHHVREFEARLNNEFARHGDLGFDDDGIEVRCRVRVRVDADDRIRESLQPVWRRRAILESEHELDMRRAHLVRERTEAWTAIFEKLQHNPVAEHGAVLAEEQFSKVYGDMLAERDRSTQSLVEVLRGAVQGHLKIGAYELAESYDCLLRAYEKRSGLSARPEDLDPAAG